MKSVIEKVKKEPVFNKKKLITLGLGIFIISIMVLSIFELSVFNKQDVEKVEYKGVNFVQTQNGWLGYKDNTPISLINNPSTLENISIDINNLDLFSFTAKNYISFIPEDGLEGSISYFFNKIKLKKNPVNACYEDTKSCKDLVIKTCDDATRTTGVIIFKYSNETKVNLSGTCLTFEGDNENLIKYVDKLTLKMGGL